MRAPLPAAVTSACCHSFFFSSTNHVGGRIIVAAGPAATKIAAGAGAARGTPAAYVLSCAHVLACLFDNPTIARPTSAPSTTGSGELHVTLAAPVSADGLRCMLRAPLALQIEAEILELEGSYLEDTATTGNILKGWDGYFHSGTQQRGGPRVVKVKNSDRIFSNSSATAPLKVFGCAAACAVACWRASG